MEHTFYVNTNNLPWSPPMRKQKLNIGDRITFSAPTRAGKPTATRKITGFWIDGRPQVRFHGYGDFIVHWREISAVIPASKATGND